MKTYLWTVLSVDFLPVNEAVKSYFEDVPYLCNALPAKLAPFHTSYDYVGGYEGKRQEQLPLQCWLDLIEFYWEQSFKIPGDRESRTLGEKYAAFHIDTEWRKDLRIRFSVRHLMLDEPVTGYPEVHAVGLSNILRKPRLVT